MSKMCLLLLVTLTFGCIGSEVPKEKCVVACVEENVDHYLRENYSTKDQFVDQFTKLCEMKSKASYACYYNGAYYFVKEKPEKTEAR